MLGIPLIFGALKVSFIQEDTSAYLRLPTFLQSLFVAYSLESQTYQLLIHQGEQFTSAKQAFRKGSL